MKTFSHVQNLRFPSPVPFVEKLPKFVLHQTKKFNRESFSKKGDVAGESQSRVQLGFRAGGWDLQREDGADEFSLLADLISVAGELSSVEHLGGFDDSELHRKISKQRQVFKKLSKWSWCTSSLSGGREATSLLWWNVKAPRASTDCLLDPFSWEPRKARVFWAGVCCWKRFRGDLLS